MRCGGAEVPTADALGRFLSACRAAGVPFKATAGLHHPLAAEGRHGFLNVIAACAFDDAAALSEDVRLGVGRAALARPLRRPPPSSNASAASSSSQSAAAPSPSRSTT